MNEIEIDGIVMYIRCGLNDCFTTMEMGNVYYNLKGKNDIFACPNCGNTVVITTPSGQ